MLRFIAARCAQALVVLFGITAVCFVILHLTGDPAALMLPESASQKDYQELRERMGFDRPLPEQFAGYMVNAARLDFGNSYHQHRPAMSIVLGRVPATFELAIVAFLIALLIALPIGIVSATHRNTAVDYGAMSSALVGQSMPNFWLGLMLMLVFSLWLDLLPVSGRLTYGIEAQAATGFYVFEGLLRLNWTLFKDATASGANYNAFVAAIQWREQRRNYIMDIQAEHSRTAAPLIAPVWLLFPGEAACAFDASGGDNVGCAGAFMLGPDWLAKPVTTYGQTSSWVWLPRLPAG
jgi:ABC-type dipeptide/oligopeptide/nickel transport system permease component